MLLEQVAHYNDLSPELRNKLTERIRGFGKSVRYKFDISNPNPDKSFYNGVKTIYPHLYTLDPSVFNITDPYEKREGKSKSKKIALVEGQDDKGVVNKFRKVRIAGKFEGILKLELEEGNEHWYMAIFLELHPKLAGGDFADKGKRQIISRIDEQAAAKQTRIERSARVKALNAAQSMSDKELVDFADAMMWDSSLDPEVLRNDVEALAENNPEFFNDLVKGETVKLQALVRQAMNKDIIAYDPVEFKFTWKGNSQPITVLSPVGDKTEVQKLAEFLQLGGEQATAVLKKLQSLVK